MHRHLLLAAVLAATAFAQESPTSGRRSPEQIFRFLDRDRSGTLSEVEFSALKDRMPSLRQRPEAVGAMFSRLDKDGNGSLTLEEYRALATMGLRRPGTTPSAETPSTSPPSTPPPAREAPRRSPMASPVPKALTAEAVDFFEKKIRPVLAGKC